eukprot:7031616-Prymnesium_polylepis.2
MRLSRSWNSCAARVYARCQKGVRGGRAGERRGRQATSCGEPHGKRRVAPRRRVSPQGAATRDLPRRHAERACSDARSIGCADLRISTNDCGARGQAARC